MAAALPDREAFVLEVLGHQLAELNIVINDARGALKLTEKRYDAVVSQPSHPWTAGASHLYTQEFLEVASEHMNAGGVFLQWLGSHFVDETLLGSFCADFVLSNGAYGGLYLAGGIAPGILSALEGGDFNRRFEEKGLMTPLLAKVPRYVITGETTGLTGAAHAPLG